MKRQCCGRLGKTESCQSGVFPAYAGDKRYGLVDYKLYIPKEWFGEAFADLHEECHVPKEKTFSPKNKIALRLLKQAIAEDMSLPWKTVKLVEDMKVPIIAERK